MNKYFIRYKNNAGKHKYLHHCEFVNGTSYDCILTDLMVFESIEDAYKFFKDWRVHPGGHIKKNKVASFEVLIVPRSSWTIEMWKNYALELEKK